jgi:uncharacterized membrane-anchored protein YhcB (DUF1043 family)
MLSITSRASEATAEGLSGEQLAKLRKVDESLFGSANDITADMATALLGPPELSTKAKAALNHYSERVTKDLADALGCKTEDITKVSEHFAQSAQKLQADLEAAMSTGNPKAIDKFTKDLTEAADTVSSETLELLGFSPKQINEARDQFAATSEQIREQIGGLVKQGKGAVRDQVRAEEAVGLAMARFARDLQRGVSRHRLDKDAEKVAKSIRFAIDPAAREAKEYKDYTMVYLFAGLALVAGGFYGYKANKAPPALPSTKQIEHKVDQLVTTASDKAQDVTESVKDAAKRAETEAKKLVGK